MKKQHVKKPAPQVSEAAWYRIFLQDGNDIIDNGTRLAPVEQLQKDLPGAAIIPIAEVPPNWADMSVQDGNLVPASPEVITGRVARKKAAHNAQMDGLRFIAYQNESDPIYMKYQRQEATEQEWLSKIEEIRQRYPKIEDEEQEE